MTTTAARERRRAACRAHHEAHREEDNARAKQWRAEHPDRVKELNREWREKNGCEYMRLRREGLKGPFKPTDGSDWQRLNREHFLKVKRENTNRRRKEIVVEALRHYSGDPLSVTATVRASYCFSVSIISRGWDERTGRKWVPNG
jgi:hypothetical protein